MKHATATTLKALTRVWIVLFTATLVAFGALVGALFWWGARTDQLVVERESALVRNNVEITADRLLDAYEDVYVSDDAVAHIVNAPDQDWIEANVSQRLWDEHGVEHVVLYAPNDLPFYMSTEGVARRTEELPALGGAFGRLIDELRARERERIERDILAETEGAETAAAEASIAAPITAHEMQIIDGRPAVVMAGLVAPGAGEVLPATPRSSIVIATKSLDEAFVAQLADNLLLVAPRLLTGDAMAAANGPDAPDAQVALPAADGAPVAIIAWAPQRIGGAMLWAAAPILALLILPTATFGAVALKRARRLASGIVASERRAQHVALHDPLTHLPNRRCFTERADAALVRQDAGYTEVAVLCIDLDRFKEINDELGHHAGDALLVEVARRIKDGCRKHDTVARMGGDEFVIVAPDTGAEDAEALASRVLNNVSQPMNLFGAELTVQSSIGVAIVEAGAVDAGEALRRSDVALYRAKSGGRNRFEFFTADMDAAKRFKREVENDLREAIARKELSLRFQPQYSPDGRELMGAEALLRWRHPQRGDISPSVFIPIAEEAGLIVEIGEWVLKESMKQAAQCPDLTIAINLSAPQFRAGDLVETAIAAAAEAGVSPSQIELEVTERLLLDDGADVRDQLHRLRQAGFHIALDDFGTGYSNLGFLRTYEVDKIKIDRSFVQNLETDADARALVRAMTSLAKALGLGIIVEGVETDWQLTTVKTFGCTAVQGYVFAHPLTVEELADRIRANAARNDADDDTTIELEAARNRRRAS